MRARRIQGGAADTVIKLRPVDPSTIDPELRRSAAFKVEVDVMPGGFVCSASFKGVCSGNEALDVASGAMLLRKLLSNEQRADQSPKTKTALEFFSAQLQRERNAA